MYCVYMTMTQPHFAARLCLLLLLSLQLSPVTSDSGDTYSGSGDTVAELQELQELQEVIPGTPGLDYPILAAVPPLPFSCHDKASQPVTLQIVLSLRLTARMIWCLLWLEVTRYVPADTWCCRWRAGTTRTCRPCPGARCSTYAWWPAPANSSTRGAPSASSAPTARCSASSTQVSPGWRRAGHVTTELASDWSPSLLSVRLVVQRGLRLHGAALPPGRGQRRRRSGW